MTRSAHPHRCLLNPGHVDRGEGPGAQQAGQCDASRRLVWPRAPGFWRIQEGATTQQRWPLLVRERESQYPQGSAA